jgi:hypothetical protein
MARLRQLSCRGGGRPAGSGVRRHSFNLDAILRYKTLPGQAVETLVFFAYPLAASLQRLISTNKTQLLTSPVVVTV